MFFLSRSVRDPQPIHGKVEIFSRHCLLSKVSQHKKRPAGFSREKCFHNLLTTHDRDQANLTLFLDAFYGKAEEHFLSAYPKEKLVVVQAGTEAASFLQLLDYIASLSLHADTIIYIVEDDYVHRPGWLDRLREGLLLPRVDYVTLYDHCDKYTAPSYSKLSSRILISPNSHWRTTPSTTNTFAVRFGTLLQDLRIHRRFSRNRSITADHDKFCYLHRKGRCLISPIPGYSTHCESEYLSPCIQWAQYT